MATSLSMTITSIKADQKLSLGSVKEIVYKTNLSLTKQSISPNIGSKIASALECVLYIHYPIYFYKNRNDIKALLNSGSEVNSIYLAYAKKIGLLV